MIRLMEKILKEKLPQFAEANDRLDFLKFSTPSSGENLYDKVIFFVFARGDKNPRLCVKTVRNYGAKEAITRNFENLQKLNKLTRDNSCRDIFAEALYLHDDGENIFSVESACAGGKQELTEKNLKILMESYISFQKCCLEKEHDFIQDLRVFGKGLIREGGFKKDDEAKLLDYFDNFSFGNECSVPKIIQHGDLTLDNMLFTETSLRVVDYDYAGINYLPGFDLFNLFLRYDSSLIREDNEYLAGYFDAVGIKKPCFRPLFFLSYLGEIIFKKNYLLKEISAVELIKNFEKILH